ncbi:hypothetical protein COU56_00095 [Candidatus Pacearchaeota archaeon CG10_big_fil_rev_8_21_14_0_10_31_9]|nr:MAG: hypothetical protein COU56_00095 [Candidatus Pacearchaeota archaeon CG10_big_fil_rev_8_21_14_0_10_31_9]PIZ82661.1 MAG: hypothetical protein COX97_03645 [Candidatus Pacearchaeota archaeon CG_4_10_14_0_2_um_filter_05_32_18]
MKKEGGKKGVVKSIVIFFLVLILIVGLFLFVTKYYLYIKFLLVEDVLVNVGAEKSYYELKNGESEDVSFNFQTTSNIFCKVECTTSFRELNNEGYNKTKIYVRPGDKVTKTYQVVSNKNGEGLSLYRFDISCNSIKSVMCPTSEFPTKRNSIISINHTLNNNEKEKKLDYEKDINLLVGQLNYVKVYSEYFYESLLEINKTAFSSSDINKTEIMLSKTDLSIIDLNEFQETWGKQNYNEIEIDFRDIIYKNNNNFEYFNELNDSVHGKINDYNYIINNLNDIYINLTKLDSYAFDNETGLSELNNTIKSYNNLVKNIEHYSNIENKIFLLNQFKIKYMENITNLGIKIKDLEKKQNSSEIIKTDLKTISFDRSKYNLTYFNFDVVPQCCLFEKCESCCFNEECRDNSYPIIFLHGHQVIKQESPEYSLESLNKLQEEIENYYYLSSGTTSIILDKNDPRIFQYFNATVTFRGSYYYDLFNDPENPVVVSAKDDDIDAYAIRLKNLVSVVKEKTGRPKVIIIGYSMGGLVTRRYVQLFGEENVDKIILIATPNQGINEDVAQYCDIFGEANHCKDMKKKSSFMNNLNNGEIPSIPVYNIIGTGCDTYGEDGDGIVSSNSAFLESAKNIYIDGTCNGLFDPLHTQIVDPEAYPETYEKIVEILKN